MKLNKNKPVKIYWDSEFNIIRLVDISNPKNNNEVLCLSRHIFTPIVKTYWVESSINNKTFVEMVGVGVRGGYQLIGEL